MAATVKHTTILVVVQAFVHLHVEAAQLGLNREKAKSARYDKEKFGIHLDTLQGRNQAAETFREVETPLEKQLQYTNFNRKIENSKLWQEFKTRLNTAKLGLQRTDPLLKLDNDRPILNYRVKRKTKLSEKQQEKLRTDQQFRAKREVVIHPQLKPEMVMQPRIEMPMEKEAEEKYQEKLSQNREKRQVLYLLDGRGVPLLFRPVRTTPNPFIRQTNIEDYEIVRPNLGEEFRPIAGDDADSDSSDVESSYQLSETSDIEYDSDYSISMSDSEDWENFPLTTPSGPNPGWGLSTLADIYQRPHRPRVVYREPNPAQRTVVRAKRSPKEKKRKIGKYKDKLKERRKRKDVKRKRRIIRNSKEDKAVKEEVKVEKAIESLLKKQVTRKRTTVYQLEDTSKEVLWYNKTHRVLKDTGVTFKWLNKTHYVIYNDNATDKWHAAHHVLVYNEEYVENITRKEDKMRKKTQKETEEYEEYDEDYYDEDFTEEEEEERADIEKRKQEIRDKERKLTKKKTKIVAPTITEPLKEEAKIDTDKRQKTEKKEKKRKKIKIKNIKDSKEEGKKETDDHQIKKKSDIKGTDQIRVKKKVKKMKITDKVKVKQESGEEGKTSKDKTDDRIKPRDKKGVRKTIQSEEADRKTSSKKRGIDKISKRKKPEYTVERKIKTIKKSSRDTETNKKLKDDSKTESSNSKEDLEHKAEEKKKQNISKKERENRPQKKTKTFKKIKSKSNIGKKTKKN
ncbi:DNA ligase 1-like isoform X3 [Homalodisca vitripennis]|uniref:DNA ligase 1-like isoform X3 n=1 Tax=Homalodisca vitripennis TaxID=197043 RepID=UPI001EEA21C2|nr:DNA ligase 1-like isoform X3 [Homalodisca vitripennis]